MDNVFELGRPDLLPSLLLLIMCLFWGGSFFGSSSRSHPTNPHSGPGIGRRTCDRRLSRKMPPSNQRHERLRAVLKLMILEFRLKIV